MYLSGLKFICHQIRYTYAAISLYLKAKPPKPIANDWRNVNSSHWCQKKRLRESHLFILMLKAIISALDIKPSKLRILSQLFTLCSHFLSSMKSACISQLNDIKISFWSFFECKLLLFFVSSNIYIAVTYSFLNDLLFYVMNFEPFMFNSRETERRDIWILSSRIYC